jgi:SAM-dependent methyltransferase
LEIFWGNKSADWFISASEYTGYHKHLADILMRHMLPKSTMCDMGCGIGLIDFALADYLSHITCVDIDQGAIELLEAESAKRNLKNITAMNVDAAKMQGAWDYGLMLFFHGKFSDDPSHYLNLFKQKLFYIVHADPIDSKKDNKPERTKCSSVSSIRRELERLGIVYQLEHHALEYGQPFSSFDEAVDFVKTYKICEVGEEESYLRANLQEADIMDYRYYLPHTKRFGMFIIGREDNAHI